jgi:hypothetical protein
VFLGEVETRLRDAERARADAGRLAYENSLKLQHEQAETQTRQVERELLESIEPVAMRWHALFYARQVCRDELQRLLRGEKS